MGRGRTDLLILWPRDSRGAAADGPAGGESLTGEKARETRRRRPSAAAGESLTGEKPRETEAAQVDRIVIECKVLHGGLERIIAEGLEQTAGGTWTDARRGRAI